MELVLVSGLSGSGKSIALKQMEDCGYYCIDNLPIRFLVDVVRHLAKSDRDEVAVALDVRSDINIDLLKESILLLKEEGVSIKTLCLTASNDQLIQRYSETRRQHPLSLRNELTPETLLEAISREREFLEPYFAYAHVIDTTGMLPSTLKEWVKKFLGVKQNSLIFTIESFGFKKGVPSTSDLVFDVRCLPNPYWIKELRPFTGKDEPIIKFLEKEKDVGEMIKDISSFLRKWLPKFREQDRHYLTVSIGCTGGQHRSVYIAEQLGKIFRAENECVIVRHRSLDGASK